MEMPGSIPLIDPNTLEFEMNVDGYVSSGGLGGPAILPQSLAKMVRKLGRLKLQLFLSNLRIITGDSSHHFGRWLFQCIELRL